MIEVHHHSLEDFFKAAGAAGLPRGTFDIDGLYRGVVLEFTTTSERHRYFHEEKPTGFPRPKVGEIVHDTQVSFKEAANKSGFIICRDAPPGERFTGHDGHTHVYWPDVYSVKSLWNGLEIPYVDLKSFKAAASVHGRMIWPKVSSGDSFTDKYGTKHVYRPDGIASKCFYYSDPALFLRIANNRNMGAYIPEDLTLGCSFTDGNGETHVYQPEEKKPDPKNAYTDAEVEELFRTPINPDSALLVSRFAATLAVKKAEYEYLLREKDEQHAWDTSEMRVRMESYQRINNDEAKENRRLRNEFQAFSDAQAEKISELNSTVQRQGTLITSLNKEKRDLNKAKVATVQAMQIADELQGRNSVQFNVIESLKTENLRLESRVKHLEDVSKHQRSTLDATHAEIHALKEDIGFREERSKKCQAANKSLSDDLDKYRLKILELGDEKQTLVILVDELKKKVVDLDRTTDVALKRLRERTIINSGLMKRVSDLQAENATLHAAREKASAKTWDYEAEVKRLREKIEQHERNAANGAAFAFKAGQDVGDLEMKNHELQVKVKALDEKQFKMDSLLFRLSADRGALRQVVRYYLKQHGDDARSVLSACQVKESDLSFDAGYGEVPESAYLPDDYFTGKAKDPVTHFVEENAAKIGEIARGLEAAIKRPNNLFAGYVYYDEGHLHGLRCLFARPGAGRDDLFRMAGEIVRASGRHVLVKHNDRLYLVRTDGGDVKWAEVDDNLKPVS